ncbi:pyruvate:ferredoxin (flavodoxin) oxidoreductase [Lactococcus lactis]|uniref:pyruvate:ferredoxin (flavodoxin) oxidoreductase n=1 Tax=Lactococcus lactis TaxID=1358 RepID=UPI0029392AB3|nr:pyruvate:ferredoxin (flavodoxin) oxidoreductase [Lactococcus lactis]WOF40784.1 pyruvate:ferredoxin (flavodoxin) oxidoreductase [Lactococcus lactis]
MSYKKTMDGNTATAYIAYAFSEVAGIYPITPSSTMAELVDEWETQGRKNIFGESVKVIEMQSEAGVAGFIHGSLKTGALTTTFTSSQGLLLMIPNMYKIAGELLPTVFHVAARSVSTNSLSIFGDHSDVMAVRQTGFAMLAAGTVQETMDLSVVAHLSTLFSSVPFLHFFDGMRTSHEMQKINVLEYDELKNLIDQEALDTFRSRAMSPNHPVVSGTNQGPDIHFQQREAINRNYDVIPYIVKKYMNAINEIRQTDYDLVNYYGDENAEYIIVAMGSVSSTIEQTVEYLNTQGRKVGFLNIRLYRPFPAKNFIEKLPKTVKSLAVLDRTKESGASGEPLLLDVQSVLYDSGQAPKIIGGRYGLGSKDTSPRQILAVFNELEKKIPKKRFTIGITDDITHLSLDLGKELDLTPDNVFQAKFFGVASDGTISANKSKIKIIGNHTDKFVQGYFYYDSRKQMGLTLSHLRFGDSEIKSSYFVENPDFVGSSTDAYLTSYDLLKGLRDKGTFLLNTTWTEAEIYQNLPSKIKKYLADHAINFYVIDAAAIAKKVGLSRKINTCMEAAFFKLTNFIPSEQAIRLLKDDIAENYGKHSKEFIEKNIKAICLAVDSIKKIEIPAVWKESSIPTRTRQQNNKYIFEILQPMESLEWDKVTVKSLIDNGMVTGEIPLGTSAYEKHGLALQVPQWNSAVCIQCNQCSFVCPHAAIRPFLLDKDELQVAPEGYKVMDFKGNNGLMYRIQVSVEDCTGCGLCVEACPRKDKALTMIPYKSQTEKARNETINWAFSMTLKSKENPTQAGTVAHTQFEKPLLEFSGACPGCGETPYVKLLTQLFGDRMMIANATGCSSIWGALAPVSPYTTNKSGQGPVWSNSLLEDNAEFGYGMLIANQAKREAVRSLIEKTVPLVSQNLRMVMKDWIEHFDEGKGSRVRSNQLISAIEEEMKQNASLKEIATQSDYFVKPSQWIIGGDGWAYDIGYGGLDHVLASGADINILVLDNEIYSNTGGQLSKGTPASAIAKFAAKGKASSKKDLGMMAMTYDNVYVAQVANGANPMQTIKAFEEAENYPGPSIVIAYVPCINHHLKGGMSKSYQEAIDAVNSGYWSLYRFNPLLKEAGGNPMLLDFKKPKFEKMTDFMLNQGRFSALREINPTHAENLYLKTVHDARQRFIKYAEMSGDAEKFNKFEAKSIKEKSEQSLYKDALNK